MPGWTEKTAEASKAQRRWAAIERIERDGVLLPLPRDGHVREGVIVALDGLPLVPPDRKLLPVAWRWRSGKATHSSSGPCVERAKKRKPVKEPAS